MKKLSSIASWLGRTGGPARLPDLGRRELCVLEALWRQSNMTAHSVRQGITDSDISLSTVQSTLERLHRKELVTREKSGRAYVYTAVLSKQNIISGLLREIADNLTDGDTAPMVSGFLDYLGEDNKPSKLDIRDKISGKPK